MTEPLTVTELDAATKDELQPPCEVLSRSQGPCSSPAEWVLHLKCAKHGKKGRKSLFCTPHMRYVIAGNFVGADCCTSVVPVVVAMERL